jgi:hypothetical protein
MRLGDIFLSDIYTEVRPKARKATPRLLSCLFLETAYIGKNFLLLLEGQFTKLLKHLLFDSHLYPPSKTPVIISRAGAVSRLWICSETGGGINSILIWVELGRHWRL